MVLTKRMDFSQELNPIYSEENQHVLPTKERILFIDEIQRGMIFRDVYHESDESFSKPFCELFRVLREPYQDSIGRWFIDIDILGDSILGNPWKLMLSDRSVVLRENYKYTDALLRDRIERIK